MRRDLLAAPEDSIGPAKSQPALRDERDPRWRGVRDTGIAGSNSRVLICASVFVGSCRSFLALVNWTARKSVFWRHCDVPQRAPRCERV